MLTLITSKKETAEAQKKLETTIRKYFHNTKKRNIGYPSGTESDAAIFTDQTYWYWSSDHREDTPNPRRLNWFGLLKDQGNLEISVEINTAYEGHKWQCGWLFRS